MKNKNRKPATTSHANHQIRIIGGQWKRSLLSVIEAEGLRPTPDRVRETAFNWLTHLLDADWSQVSCLDLFAGSGALGLEAASRGARQVTLVEAYAPAFQQLLQVRDKLQASQCNMLKADAMRFIEQAVARGEKYGVIFLDPPFSMGWLEKILTACQSMLQPSGYLYVEAEFSLAPQAENPVDDEKIRQLLAGWQVIRADKAGSVYFHILQRSILQHETHENQA
ncbi:16S rRNA (guanine(966)-N(2))-methyltransferase RsmD [Undibacterium oligocarboniphilum]|uniref:16S rRNA (Guanine(966)-N(2))-methyltransferase RsmD n=1 Tax=Undibacterium oligocarboniphilum TaxID=666702 RepID=A0A850QC05_9BURK|nr:16S rRNA (guanine(966)-N(2))-methyltransferase RsmD [Undibacterium oligocarboniphilum]MBC3871050.1 16S rRNA (guanine(966)-N(2))-methyltransferase RsmD [Undibacterium oligocarboniphilum]NVO76327.1 16S rRNA (guanine(966)-N(2))-methyltransferase RsmD [Undibacterium oligocarboniphilum]